MKNLMRYKARHVPTFVKHQILRQHQAQNDTFLDGVGDLLSLVRV